MSMQCPSVAEFYLHTRISAQEMKPPEDLSIIRDKSRDCAGISRYGMFCVGGQSQ